VRFEDAHRANAAAGQYVRVLCVCLPPTPTMAATDESASERWWKALATSVGAARRVPTAWVMRKSHSFLVGVGFGAGVRRRNLPLYARRNAGACNQRAGRCPRCPHRGAWRATGVRYWGALLGGWWRLQTQHGLMDERLHASK
jgi:hypothetical protein